MLVADGLLCYGNCFHRNLYAIGGYDQNVNVHSSVERYDPQTNSWALVSTMNVPRARLAAVVHNGQLYVAPSLCETPSVKNTLISHTFRLEQQTESEMNDIFA